MKRSTRAMTLFACILIFGCQSKGQTTDPPNSELAFNEAPANLSNVSRIAKNNEPGERIVIKGKVYESDGKTPAKNVAMYFYHTDAKGIYSKKGDEPRNSLAWWHGYNRGWLKTNEKGEYEIRTIKPASYPAHIEPAHIHVVVNAPMQKQAYDMGAITFKGDELATLKYWYQVEQNGHPRDGGTELEKNAQGVLEGRRNFVLYAQYDIAPTQSGLLIGEECPAFRPHHFWGPDKGSTACPMCKYGNKQGIMIWINTDSWSNIAGLAQSLDKKIEEQGPDKFRVFLIYMNPDGLKTQELENRLQEFAKDNELKNIAVLSIPSPHDEKNAALYRINPNKDTRNTLILYKNRRVFDKYINFDASDNNLDLLFASIRKTEYSK
jgi:protocatechuate 3,4-dioxygenase beta subunit